MQYLVGVGVADAAEEPRVGEGAFQGVALADQHLPEALEAGVEDLDAAWIERRERGFTAHQMQRGALLRAGLGEQQRSRGEVEGGEAELPRDPRRALAPAKAAGDHQ